MTTYTRVAWQLPTLVEQVRGVCLLDENGCWLWNKDDWRSRPRRNQYPRIYIEKQQRTVARWLLWIKTGKFGEVTRHTCDVMDCCNPDHLIWGSQLDNIADMVERGRVASGARNGSNTRPDRRSRGDAHRQALNPQRGDDHWSRRTPETHMSRQRRTCECGLTTNPGAFVGHQKSSGHKPA